jgi:hypothetical protein
MRKILALLIVTIPALTLLVSAGGSAEASNTGTHYCLTNSSSYCWDVKDNSYKAGQPVWLYSTSGANGLGFYGTVQEIVCDGSGCGVGPFTDTALDKKYNGDDVWFFTAGTTNLCVQLNVDTAAIALSALGQCGSADTLWVQSGHYLINVAGSDAIGTSDYFTAASNTTGAALSGKVSGTDWQQWNVPS